VTPIKTQPIHIYKGLKKTALADAMISISTEYMAKGVAVVGISSNSSVTHPQDGPDAMAADAEKYGE
jgi:hypothetical protein